ncbi:MAG: DUF2877 domain-containing protein [Candidatus Heimdallarchaeota archaeon]|nr:MAG: DUF2877 domain-containing protein [Candidatus Heimdallarchaeota archaeon]
MNPVRKEPSLDSLLNHQFPLLNEQNMLQMINSPLKEFQKDFMNLREKQIDSLMRNLSQILGYGLGSTPQSDDLFLGILTAKYCLNKEVSEIFRYLTNLPFEKLTNSRSAQLIRRFLNQNFPPEIIPFIKLLKAQLDNQEKLQFEHEVRKIRTFGNSSGYYFLLGVLWELKYNDNHISKPK